MRRLFWQEEEFYAKEIVKAFNASQVDIQVNLHILDKESYDSEITERIRAGEKVDVFDIRGISTLCDYQSQELLLDLTCQGYTRSEICRLRCVENCRSKGLPFSSSNVIVGLSRIDCSGSTVFSLKLP